MGMRIGVEGVSDRAITGRVLAGIKRSHAGERFALEEAPAAHRHLEDRAKHTIPILVP